MANPAEEYPELYASARDQIMAMIRNGQAIDLLDAWAEHKQSCAYVYSIVHHVAHEADSGIDPEVANFARNLLDDWTK